MVAEMADNRKPRTPTRDSHDLSLSPRDITRDSLVANMLLSLDQMSFGQSPTDRSFGGGRGDNTYDHEYSSRPWTNGSNGSASQGRGDTSTAANRHWHQASYSSDMDSFTADHAGKQSHGAPPSRGRRSNSGSNNFQNQLPRLNTTRETSQRKQKSTPKAGHARGGRQSNKSSGSASIDMGHPQDQVSPRSAQRPSRSASFNHGSPLQSQQHQVSKSSPFRAQLPNSFSNIEYSSAPTPTVPGGPREAAGFHIPPPPPDPVEHRTLDRKRSTSRSLKSSSGRSRRATVNQTAPALPQSSTMPTLEQDSAPAPNVGYGKAKATNPTADSATVQPKERPGFFRRVFGSSKTNAAAADSSLPASQTSSSRFAPSPDRHLAQQQQAPQQPSAASKVSSAPPSRDTVSSQPNHYPTLQKKTSFFRRRKKSIAEAAPPLPFADQVPPLPFVDSTSLASVQSNKDETSKASPASSLSQVMKPYLRGRGSSGTGLSAMGLGLTGVPVADASSDVTNTPTTKNDSHGETKTREHMREFSPDYEPSPSALIRTVIPLSNSEMAGNEPTGTSVNEARNILQPARKSFLDLELGSDHDDASSATNKNDQITPSVTKRDDGDATIRANQKKPTFSLDDESQPAVQPALGPPMDGDRTASLASGSTESGYRTAPSAPPSVRVEETGESTGNEAIGTLESTTPSKALDGPEFIVGEPTEDDRQKAQRIYDGSEDFIQKDKAAAWMGEQGLVRQRTLQAYMELYDFTGQSILASLRQVCGRLVLRAETQQVDRILAAFSKRWCVCNSNHGFKATDVIHMICYSIMLLNTDLHLADIEQKMTRSQFVKNTMTTITQAVRESAPDAFAHVRLSILPESKSAPTADSTRSMTDPTRSNRSSFRPPPRANTNPNDNEDCGPLVKAPFNGLLRAWQEQVENVLKSIYTSIRDERLPLFGSEAEKHLAPAPSQGNMSVMGMLKRSPSVLSKAPSETQLSVRGRIVDSSRNSTSRWTSKSRSRPGFGRTGFSSSRTSFDDGNSMWSPAISSAGWSKHSLGRTQCSISQDSFSSSMPRGGYQQSIGFANALSQAIIRDEDAYGQEGAPSILSADMSSTQLLEDESLELAGPPWVKEGMVIHKHHLDAHGKRAKERNWAEVFAVIQKGQISLFSFNASKSMRQKSWSRNGGKSNGPVGGGNWQDNAVNLGTFNLRLTLASALPSPGYSRSRPHVWALSLPTGAVHLFQVGSPELISEFVNTANYWSARLSTHPLVGGISNIEYGWSDSIVNNALASAINESTTSVQNVDRSSRPDSSATHGRKSSIASSSFRSSSFDQGSSSFPNNSGRGKLPADRFHIAEWAPPTQSIRPSSAPETEQLESLSAYVKGIESELQSHNLLRNPMMLAFTPRRQNAGKAMANWERKSAYLLREIVKFRTYVDCLQQAETRKQEIYAERESTQPGSRGEQTDANVEAGVNDEEGDETLRP